MNENFIEYMWYLLTAPFKKVRKGLNKWYILCRVFGKRFDEVKEDILRARDEGMVATCCHEMLQIHGADRRLTQYAGELPDNYRSRIAMYEEVCKLGGTNDGIILAVKALGFEVDIVTAKIYKNDPDRWAEFYVLLHVQADDKIPISYVILRKEVRRVKEVSAKDNYQLAVNISDKSMCCLSICRNVISIQPKLSNNSVSKVIIKIDDKKELSPDLYVEIKNDLWYFDGTYCFDGVKMFDAYEKKEEV